MGVTTLLLMLYVMPSLFLTKRTRCIFLHILSRPVFLGKRCCSSMLAGCGSDASGSFHLQNLIKEVFSSYGPLLDSKKKQSLFQCSSLEGCTKCSESDSKWSSL
ncbi:hypothetical protein L208DRAFT_1549800 [Tricholoma matsutake]|nr:hypothetical protein L208DRAFT_1549800 [Tricholoma matsutake 945]